MSMRKRFNKVEPILNELFDNGKGTRMELFKRSGLERWEEFKRHIGFLCSQGLIEPVGRKKLQPTSEFDLTEEGHELVQSLRQ